MAQHIVHLVADYGPVGDLAWSEVETALYLHGPEGLVVVKTPVPKFNETAAAFTAFQLATRVPADKADRVIVFVNVDARTHTRERITNGDGAGFYLGVLTSNVRIVGPGLETFITAKIMGALRSLVRIYTTSFTSGAPGQFRSRDIFAPIVAKILLHEDIPVESFDLASLFSLYEFKHVWMVDGYGNIKTTLRKRNLPEGDLISCLIGNVIQHIRIVDGLFALTPGELGLYPGSSGCDGDRFYELAVRYDPKRNDPDDSAAKRFNYPAPGALVSLTPQE